MGRVESGCLQVDVLILDRLVHPGEAEVEDLCLSMLGEEDVGWLDVAVHDAGRVCRCEGI